MAVKNWLFRFSHRKQNLAVRKWRLRARMIDFKKTRLILIGTERSYSYDFAEPMSPVEDPKDPAPCTKNLDFGDHANDSGISNNDCETSVSFEPLAD